MAGYDFDTVPDYVSSFDHVLSFLGWSLKLEPVLYEVLFHLDVEDVIRMRRVCKFVYYQTHERALWAHLLRHTDPAQLPPLPPVSEIGPLQHGVPARLTALQIERILVRAASLRKNWARKSPRPFRMWVHETFAAVRGLALLPGSAHLVAVQEDVKSGVSNVVLYKLDCLCSHDAEAMGSIRLNGELVPGTLQATYMVIDGVPGIFVVCIEKVWEVERSQDGPSDHAMAYHCFAVHLRPDTMEKLAQAYPPSSPEYLYLSIILPPTSRVIATPPPSFAPLSAPTAGILFDMPFVAFARETGANASEVWFQHVDGWEPIVMPIDRPPRMDDHFSYTTFRIRELRLLTHCHSVLVSSQYHYKGTKELYFIKEPPLGSRIELFPIAQQLFYDGLTIPEITHNPGICMNQMSPSGQDARVTDPALPIPPENSLYAAAGIRHDPPQGLHVFVHSPLEASPRITRCEETPSTITLGPTGPAPPFWFQPAGADWADLSDLIDGRPGMDYRILPGARYPLLYKIAPAEGPVAGRGRCQRGLHPEGVSDGAGAHVRGERVLSVHPLRDRAWDPPYGDEVEAVVQRLVWAGGDTRVGAFAWDDTVGRLVVANPERTSLKVFDFAKSPQLDVHGDRWPIPVVRRPPESTPSELDAMFECFCRESGCVGFGGTS